MHTTTRTYKTTLLLALCVYALPLTAHASKPLCQQGTPTGNIHNISEHAFTKARACLAFDTLVKLNTDISLVSDYSQAKQDFIYLEGYLLKTHIRAGDEQSRNAFCSFLKEIESDEY